jgi:hypothetical protein
VGHACPEKAGGSRDLFRDQPPRQRPRKKIADSEGECWA